MIKIIVFVKSKLAHFSQIYCGLELMAKERTIDLKYHFDKNENINAGVLKLSVDGKIIFIDIQDSNSFDKTLYDKATIYFKRMLLKTDAEKFSKLQPYGLNYSAMEKNNFLKYLFLKDHTYLKLSLKYYWFAGLLFNMNDSIANCYFKNFERSPKPFLKNLILFSTRLWDPDRNNEDWKKKERHILNNQRMAMIRKLRLEYPSSFTGGISIDNFSLKTCPDILVPKSFSHKKKYLKLLKKATICIANQGLEGSIGWKFAEYIANSAAILTTPIEEYELLGELKEGVHYLSYKSEDEFKDKLELLLNDKAKRTSMMNENHTYYKKYLHPRSKMSSIINKTVLWGSS